MSEKKNGTAWLKWLPLAALAGASAVAWGANLSTTTQHGDRIKVNEQQLKELIENRGRLDATTTAIKQNQTDIKKDVREILRYMRGRPPVR